MSSSRIAKVLLDFGFDHEFDYLIPDSLDGQIAIGMKVMVPFGKGSVLRDAYVVGLSERSGFDKDKLKSVVSVCEGNPKIPDTLLKLGEWMA